MFSFYYSLLISVPNLIILQNFLIGNKFKDFLIKILINMTKISISVLTYGLFSFILYNSNISKGDNL